MKTCFFLFVLLASTANAFTVPQQVPVPLSRSSSRRLVVAAAPEDASHSTAPASDSHTNSNNALMMSAPPKLALTTAALWAATSELAAAAGPDWGIFEGRTGSLLHPITMGGLFLYASYTAFLGFQWRRQRTLGDEISALKKSLPALGGAASVSEALTAAQEAGETAQVATLQAAQATESEIATLTQERKDLAAAGPRDKHFAQGATMAFLGTAFAIEGPLNTYARAGKLFPGPHLYAGAGLVVLWALAVATVPAMQKGSDTARTIHIGANVLGLSFFAWQVTSGIPILFKVLEFTKWP